MRNKKSIYAINCYATDLAWYHQSRSVDFLVYRVSKYVDKRSECPKMQDKLFITRSRFDRKKEIATNK